MFNYFWLLWLHPSGLGVEVGYFALFSVTTLFSVTSYHVIEGLLGELRMLDHIIWVYSGSGEVMSVL